MKIIKKSNIINQIVINNKNVGFVPTMGTLHEGHISLIQKSKKKCSITIVSIFVNPKQFNKKKDFLTYPKKISQDLKICEKLQVDYLFLPSFNEVYHWKNKKVIYPKIDKIMEHKFRKNHFKGVLDVMSKLLSIIPNSKVFMGKKDYQQYFIIKNFCQINNLKSQIVPCDTVRSKFGFALSSRNLLLNFKSHKIMSKVYKIIKNYKKNNYLKKFSNSKIKNLLKKVGIIKIDYINLINLSNLKISKRISKKTNIFIAYYLDSVRLIDNI